MEMSTALIWSAGLHLSLRMSRQMRPSVRLLTDLVDVGMEDLGPEQHLGRHHWILIRKVQLGVEHASGVGRVLGSTDLHVEVAEVVLVRRGIDAND